MTDIIKVKGHQIPAFNRKLASYRRAINIQNDIQSNLHKLGIHTDSIELCDVPKLVIRKGEAKVEWWQEEDYLLLSYNQANSFIENLHIISKVLEKEIALVLAGQKSKEEFIREFSEDSDVEEQRQKARALLGIKEDCLDLNEIDKAYKKLAMQYHPDRPEGDHEKFKEVNKAHKILKRELQ